MSPRFPFQSSPIAAPLHVRVVAALGRPVSGQSLAVFRILFGALILIDCWRFVLHDRLWRYWVAPEFHFTYAGFGWVVPLPEPWLQVAWGALALCAVLVMAGLFYRPAIVLLTLLFSYFFLLDKAEYLNHFYLVLLFAALLCVVPAARVWSLDALRRRCGPRTVPYAAIWLMRAQLEIVLIFAGLVKLTPDWLAGEPLGLWLRPQADAFPLGVLFQYDWVLIAASWGTIALHVLGAPLLLWRRTRLAMFATYCVFHLLNANFFNIGIFPWLTMAATLLVFAPDWPSRLAARLGLRPVPEPAPLHASPPARFSSALMVLMAIWGAVQVALPLRSLAFPTEVRWAGDGHRFSWRMRIYDRQAEGYFQVIGQSGQTWTVRPEDWLTPRQSATMLTRADMIHQFANHVGDRWRAAGHGAVKVHAHVLKSLNGRPPQLYVDPAVDLAAVELNLFGPDPWVRPLERTVWGAADNRRQAGAAKSATAGNNPPATP
ncbi:HTTM domain-containing protein [Xanthobacteraceae bacterium A53D]